MLFQAILECFGKAVGTCFNSLWTYVTGLSRHYGLYIPNRFIRAYNKVSSFLMKLCSSCLLVFSLATLIAETISEGSTAIIFSTLYNATTAFMLAPNPNAIDNNHKPDYAPSPSDTTYTP